jgi:hypothetical protein
MALVRTDVSEELSASLIRVIRVFLRSVRGLLVTASFVPISPILVTLMKEALSSSDMSVQEPHGVTSQKTQFFIVTAVNTSNLTLSVIVTRTIVSRTATALELSLVVTSTPGACLSVLGRTVKRTSNHDPLRGDLLIHCRRNVSL